MLSMTYTNNSDDLFLEVSNAFATEKQLKKPKISPESSRKPSDGLFSLQ